MEKRAKFFCESCGNEVKQNDKICSHCGRFFSSVKCPKCGLSGNSRMFTRGCPKCGYAFGGGEEDKRGAVRARKKNNVPLPRPNLCRGGFMCFQA
ncbi:zinc-ribbon domain-containing protein [Brucepastera parasyntrophica]|uniref:zinc-ribbon domain-containing protein n=1 Tax=Brucepastera parasyntrophica TaxID=2880008 RepID=UPI0034E2F39E